MGFFSGFKKKTPDIILRLQEIRVELDSAQEVLKGIMDDIINNMLQKSAQALLVGSENVSSDPYIKEAMDNMAVPIWLKDFHSQFIYLNKEACRLFQYPMEELLSAKGVDIENNTLFKALILSDSQTLQKKTTTRFIEFGELKEQLYILDTIRSPLFSQGEIFGVMGSNKSIKDVVPKYLQNISGLGSIEVPIGATLDGAYLEGTLGKLYKAR